VNQYLFAFKQAADDFAKAIKVSYLSLFSPSLHPFPLLFTVPHLLSLLSFIMKKLFESGNASVEVAKMNGVDPSSVPRLTAMDAHNSHGFANALQALYPFLSPTPTSSLSPSPVYIIISSSPFLFSLYSYLFLTSIGLLKKTTKRK
jgi:hypothetical protein